MGTLFGVLLALLAVIGVKYLGVYFWPGSSTEKQIFERARVIDTCIEDYYQGEVDQNALVDGATKGMVSALGDKYSEYYTEEEYERIMNDINGSYVGVGLTLQQDKNGAIVVKGVTGGGPAEQAGIEEGDRIVAIDGTQTGGMTLDDFIGRVKIEDNKGKTVVFTIERESADGGVETLEKQVLCEEVKTPSIKSEKMGDIGYIRIMGFHKETDEQFAAAVENMESGGAAGLVLDVRDNGGGSLDTTINMLNRLLPEGDLIVEKSRKDGDTEYRSDDRESYDGKMVVLINENSASASEVFAGTLQARGAAELVGTKSFGKGIVQTVLSLQSSCGGGLKLTTAEYFLPGDVSIHKKGLTPDVELEYTGDAEEYAGESDNQLQKALELVRE